MIIGIDASRAFVQNRTGIEEYSYQVIRNLMNELKEHQVILYIRRSQKSKVKSQKLPESWNIKVVKWPYLWTQIGLSLELLFHPVDTLFVPAHTVPIIHPENTIVTVHGLEYEFCPKAYSFWERVYMRLVIKNSCKWSKKIIAVSKNTKRDLIKLYKVPEEKVEVVYNGVSLDCHSERSEAESRNLIGSLDCARDDISKYLLFVGRLEERKNVLGIVEAFEILKEKHKIPHELVLAGNAGYGYDSINLKIQNSKFKEEIISKGFVSDDEKYDLLKNADIFLFPSFYEGFGLPILEAQAVGTPVITSNISSMPEITLCHSERAQRVEESKENSDIRSLGYARDDIKKYSAMLVNPNNPQEIAEATFRLISDESLKNDIINKGFENVKRFSWEKCAEEIGILLKQ